MKHPNTESPDQTVRRILREHSVVRRDELLLALAIDAEELDRILDQLIRRGEAETLRPFFPDSKAPCFYRCIRNTDRRYLDDQKRCRISRNRLFDLAEIEMA